MHLLLVLKLSCVQKWHSRVGSSQFPLQNSLVEGAKDSLCPLRSLTQWRVLYRSRCCQCCKSVTSCTESALLPKYKGWSRVTVDLTPRSKSIFHPGLLTAEKRFEQHSPAMKEDISSNSCDWWTQPSQSCGQNECPNLKNSHPSSVPLSW